MSRSHYRRNKNRGENIVVLGTSAPNRFCTTSSVLSFFYKNHIIRKFEVEQCSIHQNGEIMIRFGTKFAAQLFALKLQISESSSRYFQVIKLCSNELAISQYIVLNLCVQRRSRDGNRFGNIIRRWRGEGIIDCNADRRQFYIYLFKDASDLNSNDSYIKLSFDDRILERICLLNNDYSAGIQFQVSEPPKCEIHKAQSILSIDQHKKSDDATDDSEECENKCNKGPICPKILLTGSCTNKACTFRHNIHSSDSESSQLGNDEQFWLKDKSILNQNDASDDDSFIDEEEIKQQYRNVRYRNHNFKWRNNHNNNMYAWKPSAYYSFKQPNKKSYNLDKTSDELEQDHNSLLPWTFEIDNGADQDTLHSLGKFLGQCWIFCIEFVRMKEVPERFVNAIRQMRDINPSHIESLSTDYEARYPIPNIFTINMTKKKQEDEQNSKIYYHPPFQYMNSSRSSELRLKRHLHDLNYHGAHDVAFALEACLHNFPPVFIPEDLVDNQLNFDVKERDDSYTTDPDIFFKCIHHEIKSISENDEKEDDEDTFSNLMNQSSHYNNANRSTGYSMMGMEKKKKINNMDLAWQALLYCAKSEEYRMDRSVVLDDAETTDNHRNVVQKQNVLPALELFYKSLDWAGSNGRVLKQKKNGNTHADHVWIKRVSVHPSRLSFAICEEESTRMFRFKQYSPPTDFCRIEFMDQFGGRSMPKEHFQIGNLGRYRAYKILNNGLFIAGVVYQFLFFGNKQVRDAKCWMKAELIKGFDANRVRADIARLSQERNIGKKMDRFHLFMSKGTPGSIYNENEIEIIDDIYAQDGKILTDGCSLILADELKRSFPHHVASMLVRIGGAKTQMMSASKQLLEQLVLDDIKKKGGETKSARNLSPKIILTKSCLKFMTDTQKQLEIKKCSRALPCMMNREFINHCVFHQICDLQHETLDIINSKQYEFDVARAFKLAPSNKQIILQLLMKYQRLFTNQLEKMEDICAKQMDKLKEMKQKYGARAIYIRPATQEEQKHFFDTLLFLASRLKVEEPFLNRLTNALNKHSGPAKRLNFKDIADLSAILKRLWGGLKSKFKIQLSWPSCRMAGIADFQYKLSEFQVFLKIKIPDYYDWDCLQCGKKGIKYWNDKCENSRCGANHPIYYIHQGPIGLMKNPCLHPGSYRLFQAVYYKELDDMFDGEVLVFSASSAHSKTSQVHKLSGGDLDGDDFLCVVQKDLLPLEPRYVKCMQYDADKPLKMSGYVDIGMCVEYWLNYQINDCVGIIAELHESFSDLELAVGTPQCIELAKAHSKAVDYAKTGIAAQIPRNVGIPFPVSLVKYPHHMGKHQSISYKSTSIKGILYNSVRIPTKLWRDKEFRKQHNLKNNLNVAFCENPNVAHYERQKPMKQTMTNREKLRGRLNRGCQICGIASFNNAHTMNQHKDDPIHKRNKQMARDKAMLQRIKDAKINALYQTNIPAAAHDDMYVNNNSRRYTNNYNNEYHHNHKRRSRNNNNNIYNNHYKQEEHNINGSTPPPSPSRTRVPSLRTNRISHSTSNPLATHTHKHQHHHQRNNNNKYILTQREETIKQQPNNNNNKYNYNYEKPLRQEREAAALPLSSIKSKTTNRKQHYNNNKTKRNSSIKRHEHWAVGDHVLYKNKDACTIKDILYDSYPPRVLLQNVSNGNTIITDFYIIQHSSYIEEQIKESKDAAIKLGFDETRVNKEMQLFLEVVKVSGHSLNPSCFLNYLCEITQNESN